ncbi:MAG TPA: hypothetical protein ENG87_05845 [Candidatus Pacearchaeota archaeon]|nr:hypothetical protein [Candidatus Pacearchaeota archaeon]
MVKRSKISMAKINKIAEEMILTIIEDSDLLNEEIMYLFSNESIDNLMDISEDVYETIIKKAKTRIKL